MPDFQFAQGENLRVSRLLCHIPVQLTVMATVTHTHNKEIRNQWSTWLYQALFSTYIREQSKNRYLSSLRLYWGETEVNYCQQIPSICASKHTQLWSLSPATLLLLSVPHPLLQWSLRLPAPSLVLPCSVPQRSLSNPFKTAVVPHSPVAPLCTQNETPNLHHDLMTLQDLFCSGHPGFLAVLWPGWPLSSLRTVGCDALPPTIAWFDSALCLTTSKQRIPLTALLKSTPSWPSLGLGPPPSNVCSLHPKVQSYRVGTSLFCSLVRE